MLATGPSPRLCELISKFDALEFLPPSPRLPHRPHMWSRNATSFAVYPLPVGEGAKRRQSKNSLDDSSLCIPAEQKHYALLSLSKVPSCLPSARDRQPRQYRGPEQR
jgi:hypothetical protein